MIVRLHGNKCCIRYKFEIYGFILYKKMKYAGADKVNQMHCYC